MYSLRIDACTNASFEVCQQLAWLTSQVPELDNPVSAEYIQQRIGDVPCLILTAYVEDEIAGFKIGYQKADGEFYSYLGGVLPDFRQLGLAQSMLEYQEKWASEQGYKTLSVKTRNCFRGMLKMLVSNRYNIINIEQSPTDINNQKLNLQKQL